LRKNPQRRQVPNSKVGQRDRVTRRHQARRLDALECVDQSASLASRPSSRMRSL
jgi:hypothetical protein